MILFFESGRLGNQLFQYSGLRQSFPEEHLIFIGCSDLDALIETDDVAFIRKDPILRWLHIGLFARFMTVLSRWRIIGCIREVQNESSYSVSVRIGFMRGIPLLQPAYFQHSSVVKSISGAIAIKPKYVDLAKSWLNLNSVRVDQNNLVFVHIRRGDYLSWPNRTSPAVLSLSWYLEAMATIRSKVSTPLFIVLTDDPYYAKDVFSGLSDVLISDNEHLVDFALMSLCRHGILSASSFAWWGAWFSRKTYACNGHGIYLAPKYWAGHRSKRWFPDGFVTDWISYIE